MSKIRMAAVLGLTALLAACSENSMAPRDASPTSSVAGGGANAALTSTDTIRFSITIEPWHTTYYNLGSGNSITFPAHSLCVLGSSYGPTEWDKPCAPAWSSLTVNVTAWLDGNGHARVDFDKHIRFVPSVNPSQWVVLTFADLQASLNPFFNILYCPDSGACYDESKLDPSLATVRDPVTGKVTRRIKHFSGYNVAAGDDIIDGGIDPTSSLNRTMGDRSLSVSTADLPLDDLESVAAAHPELNAREVETMLNLIRRARKFSGYILASG
jgi:hypothetical protein